jgi:hypothetical protein
MNRRHFLQSSFAFAAISWAMNSLNAQQGGANQNAFIHNGDALAQKHLTVYPDTENERHQLYQLWVSQDNHTLLSYRAHQTQKYPFFSPMAGPLTGLPLTTETGRPWPHHRGVFFGLDNVNGGNYWQDTLARGQIISQGPSFAKEDGQYKLSATTAEIVDRCLWKRGTADPIIEDQRRFVVKVLDERRYILDADIVMKALTDVTVTQTNHGLFGVRCAPDLAPTGGGTMESSEGVKGEQATLGKPARWMAFYGKRAKLGFLPERTIPAFEVNPPLNRRGIIPLLRRGSRQGGGSTESAGTFLTGGSSTGEIVEGIAVFCPSKAPHPAFRDCPWFTRDYGNISPMPFNWLGARGDNPFKLSAGEELKLRYRVVAFGGTPKDAGLDALWEEFDKAG